MSAAPSQTQPFGRLPLAAKLNLAVLGLAVAALSARLWPQWQHNPDLSHGLFMPVVFLLLLHEARKNGTPRFLREGPGTRLWFGALLTVGLLALGASGLYAAAVDWSHALVNFMLTVSLALFLGAALIAYSGTALRFVGFNWSAAMAVWLWLLSAPIPPGTYTRLTLGLQLWVSEGVLRTLHILGIAAVRHGNIIHMANTTVGVEEACSGIRSLVSCVFAGFFFSATLVRQPWARVLIIGLSAPLALGMNFIRSLTLTLLSNNGVDIMGLWHDATGFAVLGVTAAMLGGLALLLERGGKGPPPPTATEETASPGTGTVPGVQWILGGGLAVALAMVVFFITNTRPTIRHDQPVPDLLALMPASPPGWQVTTSDLYEFAGTLQTDHLAQRRYAKTTPAGPLELTIYVAYWKAGQAPVSLVASHTPDACWPGAGWTALPVPEARANLVAGGRALSPAETRLFKTAETAQHVWYWHLYDGRPIAYQDPYSPAELLRIAWRFGFRHDGDQVFVRVSSNRPWADIAGEPLLAEFFGRTQPLGL
jgi:exosortase